MKINNTLIQFARRNMFPCEKHLVEQTILSYKLSAKNHAEILFTIAENILIEFNRARQAKTAESFLTIIEKVELQMNCRNRVEKPKKKFLIEMD